MATPRLSLEALGIVLLVGGAIAAIGGDRLSMPAVREAGVLIVLGAAVVFGLDMIVKRRAEIATRYSSDIDPAFHVFRGWPAVAWGLSIALFTGTLIGYAVIEMTGWAGAREFFRDRPEILLALGGLMVAAWGFGSAGKATHRYHAVETPTTRWGDRIGGVLAAALGLCLIAIAAMRLVAPSVLDALRASTIGWLAGWIRSL